MAEEHHINDEVNHDDQSVMSQLLQTVKGLSPISMTPIVDDIVSDDALFNEQFEFE